MSGAAAVLVVAEDAVVAATIPGVNGVRLRPLLVERAQRWARRVAPDSTIVMDDQPGHAASRGERISQAATGALARYGGPLLIVSADCPTLSASHDRAALADLGAGCDLTVGPFTTGDWFLLGLVGSHRGLLDALAADASGAETMRTAALAGLKIGLLGPERPLRRAIDADALRADPLTPPDLLAALTPARINM